MSESSTRLAIALTLAGLLGVAPIGKAISTDPVLFLQQVDAVAGKQTRVVRLVGTFPAEDMVQFAFDMQILVRDTASGTGFVRFDLDAGSFVGSAIELADGLDPAEVAAIAAAGTSAPDGRVLLLTRDRIELELPLVFSAGTAEAVLFTIHEGVPILSNAVSFVIPGLAP